MVDKQCDPVEEDGQWICHECGHIAHKRFFRQCGFKEPERLVLVDAKDVEIRAKIEGFKDRIETDRSVDESMGYFKTCMTCRYLRRKSTGLWCSKDKNCGKYLLFVLRILKRRCDEWPTPMTEDSTGMNLLKTSGTDS